MVWHVRCLKDAVMPIIWLNCIFCMGVFEIPKHRPRLFLSVIYTLMMMIGYFVLLYNGILIFAYSGNLTLFYCVLVVNILVATCSILLFWRKSQKTEILLKKMGHADDTLEALGIKKNYRKTFYDVLGCTVIWVASILLLSITHAMWMWHDIKYGQNFYIALCFSIPIMINSVVDLTSCSLIRCVKLKFQYINILVNDVVLSANDAGILKIHNKPDNTPIAIVRSNYRNNKDTIVHLLQTLRQLHLELTRIAHDINGAYCLQILLEMAVHFTIITVVLYSLYSVIIGTTLRMAEENEKIVAMVVWGTTYSIKIIVMNNICTTASYESYKTGEIIQTFDGSVLNDELREEIRQFTEQIILNSLDFTAAGFFKIDNVLTGSFFATVTTYVVILIQMNTPV
ncbi:putative gustatory receptor 28b [Odontomachus brunneus]|uniref:putative gustatory receptor 28b n=1 Tax=Odontomachus brunneus TaxID=486640 RepID=UPI0013F1A1C4|nr:putative gustatory receptor 28b [Odontomachus brunneus]